MPILASCSNLLRSSRSSARGEQLLEGKPFLSRVLDHLDDHRRGPGMNDPNDPITTDLVLADGVGIGRHGSPITTKSIAVRRHSPASSSVTSLRTVRFLMTHDSNKNRRNGTAITLAPKKLILTRRASEGSASEPSLARRVSMCKDAKLSCRGNIGKQARHALAVLSLATKLKTAPLGHRTNGGRQTCFRRPEYPPCRFREPPVTAGTDEASQAG